MRKHIAIPVTALALTLATGQLAHAEKRGYVISVWSQAMNNVDDSGCPTGKNAIAADVFKYTEERLGVPEATIKQEMDSNDFGKYYREQAPLRGRIDGKPVFIYEHPLAEPDPHIKLDQSPAGFGFNLDGKVGPLDYTDPLTHETGVDNVVARVIGCIDRTRGTLENPVGNTMLRWGHIIEGNSWLLTVDNNRNAPLDLKNEDNVTVKYERGLQPPMLNAAGFQRNVTYTIDPNTKLKTLTTFKGKIKDGMFLSDVTPEFRILGTTRLQPVFDFKQAKMRLSFRDDGSLQGFVGGYSPITMVYFPFGDYAGQGEGLGSGDVAGIYQTLQKYADTDIDKAPDGKRTRISQTWTLTAMPAFLIQPPKGPEHSASAAPQGTQFAGR